MADRKIISIITPCYNEEDNVTACYEAVRRLFEAELAEYDYEHIFSDNCSTDRTVELLKGLAEKDARVKVIVNSRNYGAFHSLFNALMSSRGDAAVAMLAADLQDPPELIADFVNRWAQGYEVVYGVKAKREEGWLLRSVRRAYYRLVSRLSNIDIPPDVSEFQLVDRRVVEALREFEDYYPYVRGMIANCGFRSTGVEYTWKARQRGHTKTSLYRLIDQGLNGLISSTNVPMRLCMFAGFFLSVISILTALVHFFVTVFYRLLTSRPVAPPGVPTLIVAIFFFGGVQLFFLGVLGEYISAIHFQVRKRPLVIERERINF
ncbi:hypothetical protein LCGC14_1976720 [marine sediment metagenome]|uniref:Glycosyltransferase 2-like domain-containing protein n=1 Tax=marine sediment metagenome TaxID=412755 RepID=A0A0F9I754_9ZZZZ